MIFKLGCLLLIYFCFVNDCFGVKLTPIVQTESGPVRGLFQKNALSGKWFRSFLGIPYAEPPLGERRFSPPVPIKKWENVLDATKFGNMCPQSCPGGVCGDEDCLFLNVYAPFVTRNPFEKLKPVMVWIHGGAFVKGSGNSEKYGPDYLVDKDVILVTFNYRLGVFGFLNLGHELVPGNAGLKDQNMVLKWVKKNIMRFGGDPDNITLFGQSAGAVAVDLHNIADMSKGLYARSIAMSGSVFCPWGFLTFEDAQEKGHDFVEQAANRRFRSIDEIVKFVLDAPVNELITTVGGELLELIQSSEFKFAPSIEVVGSSQRFIDDCYLERFEKGLYHPGEHMMGFTSLESGVVVKALVSGANNYVGAFLGGFTKEVWHLVHGEKLFGLERKSDKLFNAPIDLKQKYLTKYGSAKDVYYYYFSYLHKTSPAKGVSHNEDLQYVFYQKDNPHLFYLDGTNADKADSDSVTRDHYVTLIANFAKTGKPSYGGADEDTDCDTYFEWERSEQTGRYLNISKDLIMENERPISPYAVNLQNDFSEQFKRGACVLNVLHTNKISN